MAQALLDDLGVDSQTEQKGGVAVAQVVEADTREASLLQDLPEVPLREVVGVQWPTVGLTENQPVVVPAYAVPILAA